MDKRKAAYLQDLLRQLKPSDVRGISRLAADATLAVTKVTEGVHQAIWNRLGFPHGNTPHTSRGLTGLVYKSIYGITSLVGTGLDTTFAAAESLLDPWMNTHPDSPQREGLIAALNGVMGDQLQANNSPLALSMQLRLQNHKIGFEPNAEFPPPTLKPKRKLVLLIHGLCLNDFQRYAEQREHTLEHGAELSKALGYMAIYLRYNTGLHISENGKNLSNLLEQLVQHYQDDLDELAVVAHSMGGLVMRSACYYAEQNQATWPNKLRHIVFLGTPHQGATLERAGNWLDALLGSTEITRPFKRLGQLRSAGVTDLRYGNIREDDWQGQDRHQLTNDLRHYTPLPEKTECFAIAASNAPDTGKPIVKLAGDGLVSVASALGAHRDAEKSLAFKQSTQWIAYNTAHMRLLNSPDVSKKMIDWLGKWLGSESSARVRMGSG